MRRPTVSNSRPERQRAEEVRDPERDQVQARDARVDLEELGQDDREREDDRVVDERLGREQRETEHRAARVAREQRAGDLAEAGRLALLDLDLLVGLLQWLVRALGDLVLDLRDQPLGLAVVAVDHQPARTLGDVAADEHDPHGQRGAEEEREPPADVGGEDVLVEQHAGEGGAERRAEPVGAVDRKIDPAAGARGDQLVDGTVDRAVLAADPEAGEEAEQPERARRSSTGR